MLKLSGITKDYLSGENTVRALNGIDLEFRKSEFVAILGPSGCGKTTLLNIIGGLDRYTKGELFISSRSTKLYKDKDWDDYRNKKIGFVFQNYNLIFHQSVLKNVELALTLSGVSVSERKKRAEEALKKVGLCDQLHKRPYQLSGGQMQRVAIARALVNNPEIILADEPTGALDSTSSVQIMEILKEISKEKLVIMVTHNHELAKTYSTRIVTLLDGILTRDSNSYQREEVFEQKENPELFKKEKKKTKSSMSFFTALKLSFFNLFSKKGRTLLISFASSIGIIGIALILAIQNGFSKEIYSLTAQAFSGAPMSITAPSKIESDDDDIVYTEYPKEDIIYAYEESPKDFIENVPDEYKDLMAKLMGSSDEPVSKEFQNYIKAEDTALNQSLYNDITYTYDVNLHLISRFKDEKGDALGDAFYLNHQMVKFQELLNNEDFLISNYDILSGNLPENKNEIVLIVDAYNRISITQLMALGIYSESGDSFSFEKIIGSSLKLATNDDFFIKHGEYYVPANYDLTVLNSVYEKTSLEKLSVCAILRKKAESKNSLLSSGFGYTPSLTRFVLESAKESNIVKDFLADKNKPLFNIPDLNYDPDKILKMLGAVAEPVSLNIYPVDLNAHAEIKQYIDEYNLGAEEKDKIQYIDIQAAVSQAMNTMVKSITYLLIGFTAISLLVSSIMIGVITYISVLERTKEVGILRSIGARKIDISRLFNAETVIIGGFAGLLGVFIAWILTFPVNAIIKKLVGATFIGNVAVLSPVAALILVLISVMLTLIAGAIPSKLAAKKDPVTALRTE